MVPIPFFYEFLLLGFLCVCIIVHVLGPYDQAAPGSTTPKPAWPLRMRSYDPKPLPGARRKLHCDSCAQSVASRPQAPCVPPRLILTRGRRRQVDTSAHCCPHAPCASHSWVGFSNLRANGHPRGGRWRQLYCLGCDGYFLATHDTPFGEGKRVAPEWFVRAVGALAEGLGLRAVTRVFEVDPNPVLPWLVEGSGAPASFCTPFSP